MLTYEQKLNANLEYALREGSMHFEEKNAVHETLRRITRRLNELGIPYAVVGGMAMFAHGFRRFTEDVDLLVTRPSMDRVIAELEGLGYVKPFKGSTTKLRDTDTGVQIEFLITGGFPGDGKPKPVAFPDPENVSVEIGGARYVGLPTLLELKLASGTAAHRMKDLGDVQELIKALSLPREMAAQLDPFVRARYEELWDAVANRPADE
jgi:hypothetical protein